MTARRLRPAHAYPQEEPKKRGLLGGKGRSAPHCLLAGASTGKKRRVGSGARLAAELFPLPTVVKRGATAVPPAEPSLRCRTPLARRPRRARAERWSSGAMVASYCRTALNAQSASSAARRWSRCRWFAEASPIRPRQAQATRPRKRASRTDDAHSPSVRRAVPSIVCGPPPLRPISIRRGFACSATGSSSVSTPPS